MSAKDDFLYELEDILHIQDRLTSAEINSAAMGGDRYERSKAERYKEELAAAAEKFADRWARDAD